MLLNCDLGESYGPWRMGMDAHVMPHIDLANIACGFHGGDPLTLAETLALAREHGVGVGAHPAYPDLVGFGRRSLACSAAEIENLVLYQIGALAAICRAEGTELSYVKPHGALYNDKARSEEIFTAVAKAVVAFDPKLPLMTLAIRDTSRLRQLAEAQGVTLLFEAFADRGYDENGHLLSRRLPGAVHHDPEIIIDQARRIAMGEALTASEGSALILEADALCVHGDNAESVASVRRIREMLDAL